jgi:hypothetical protein
MHHQFVTTKAELLDHIERDWTALNDLIKSLTPAQIIQIKNADGWTIKDHLTHVTAWEQSVIAFLKGEPRHEGLGVPEAVYLNGSEDEINDIIFKKRRYQPLDTVLDNWQVAHEQVMALVNALDDDDLQKRYSHYLPDEPGEGEGPPAINVIYGNTADHFRMHQGWMEEMIGTAKTVE